MKLRTFCRLVLICAASMAIAGDAPPAGPPKAEVRPVTEDYFGTRITDPYRYFENISDPQVQSWIKAQADYTHRTLQSLPGRERLLRRIVELDEGAPYNIWITRRWPNGDLHYLKRLATENLDKFYFRDARTSAERLLIDPERLGTPETHVSLTFTVPSPDKRYVAYGLAAAGSELTTLHVLDTTTGRDTADVIDRMEAEYVPPAWLPDSAAFVYSRRRKLPPGAPPTEIYKQSRAFLHRLGTDPEHDPVLFAMGLSPAAPMADVDFPALVVAAGSRFAVGQIKHGDARELTLYAAPLDSLASGDIPWKKVCDVDNEVHDYTVHGDDIYLVTADGAPHYKVVRTPLGDPRFAAAEMVLPNGAGIVESLDAGRDALYVGRLEAGLNTAVRIAYASAATPQPIAAPAGMSSASPMCVSPDVDGAFVAAQSWTRAFRIYAFDPASGALSDTRLRPEGKFDAVGGYEAEEVQVRSHDGVLVPLSILHTSGLRLDGSHPALVDGYGSYGMTMTPHFRPTSLAWLERGGVLAFAHVRGGGEFGKDWHESGRKATKPNTWKDFIACCEYLVKKGYTSPARLAGQGGSAGGILIGRSITDRPDLFAAAIINVGCLDMLRFETTTNGVPNIPEFGSTRTKEGFEGLYAMSSLHHVTDGVAYPAVLLTAGINDPRVEPWESAKMAARLQAATSSGKPVLLRIDYDAGHGIGSTKRQHQEQLADEWAFLLWQMHAGE